MTKNKWPLLMLFAIGAVVRARQNPVPDLNELAPFVGHFSPTTPSASRWCGALSVALSEKESFSGGYPSPILFFWSHSAEFDGRIELARFRTFHRAVEENPSFFYNEWVTVKSGRVERSIKHRPEDGTQLQTLKQSFSLLDGKRARFCHENIGLGTGIWDGDHEVPDSQFCCEYLQD